MAAGTRDKMVAGAVQLLALKGLHETSFHEVLALTATPRGSIYHHFPDGKDQLVGLAVDTAGDYVSAAIDSWAGLPAVQVTARFVALWREVLERSGMRAGCSVLAVTTATDSGELLDHTATVFRTWRGRLAAVLAQGGVRDADATRFAALLIASIEGAVVLTRAERSLAPFDLVADELMRQVGVLQS